MGQDVGAVVCPLGSYDFAKAWLIFRSMALSLLYVIHSSANNNIANILFLMLWNILYEMCNALWVTVVRRAQIKFNA